MNREQLAKMYQHYKELGAQEERMKLNKRDLFLGVIIGFVVGITAMSYLIK